MDNREFGIAAVGGLVGTIVGAAFMAFVHIGDTSTMEFEHDLEVRSMIARHAQETQDLEYENARLRSRNGALNAAVQGFEAREAERQAEMDRIAEEQRLAERVAAIIAEMDND